MKARMVALVYLLSVYTVVSAAEISRRPITGAGLPSKTVVITIDDAPDEPGPDGQSQTSKMAWYLNNQGIRATFFMVGCHFVGQPNPDPRSWICQARGAHGLSIIYDLISLGHNVGNHTEDHVPLTFLPEDNEILYQVGMGHDFFSYFQSNRPVFLRTPGLAYDDRVFRIIQSTGLNIIGPIDQDTGGQGRIDGEWIGGDWDCYRKGYGYSTCGDLYLNAIQETSKNQGHGSLILMHARTEYMDGRDGSHDFPINLLTYLVQRLSEMGYAFAPIEAIPAVRSKLVVDSPKPDRRRKSEPEP